MSEEKTGTIKVTDKRMFGPDGSLREEYRFLEGETGASAPEPPTPPPPPQPAPAAAAAAEAGTTAGPGGPRLEIPPGPEAVASPSFFDLVALLAEPVALYLGDLQLPDGRSAENLDMARLHIDLLDVLRHKTAGNLGAGESAFLDDLLYRLRLRYVQKRG